MPATPTDGLDLVGSPSQRNIAYFDENYDKTLMSILDGVISKEDVIATLSLSGTWEPVGQGNLVSGTEYFAIRNMTTNFHTYWIHITNITSDIGIGLDYRMSTDNGLTFKEGSVYSFTNRWGTLQGTTFPLQIGGSTGSSLINSRVIIGANVVANVDMKVYYPAQDTKYTRIDFTSHHSNGGGSNSDFLYESSSGTHDELTADNAIGIYVGGGGDITGGFVSVWGQRADI